MMLKSIIFACRETQVLALDCERVLTDKGERLARVSIVNFYGNIVFDTLVRPRNTYYEDNQVIDYREWITGIKAIDLDHAPTFGNIEPIVSNNQIFPFYLIIFVSCNRLRKSSRIKLL